jgi:ABC-type nickel/cobalt efflux system permease component RcnA
MSPWLWGDGPLPALGVALLLGLRHASDPDHVTAVATLALSPGRRGTRSAAALGLAWGLGHAVTLVLLGLPVVLAGVRLPAALQRAAELGVGVVIVVLAARLLARWRRGELHVHPHAHGALRHAHPHVHVHEAAHAAGHAHEATRHDHGAHDHRHRRSPLAAFGVGLIHGIGGSAAAGVLLLASSGSREAAALALALFALGTAAAMTAASAAMGLALARGPLARRIEQLAPAFGVAGVAFGAWYAFAALASSPVP